MDCPRCNAPLRVADRNGIQIDHCPHCRGVWLDRGELDKLIERATGRWGDDDSEWGDDHRRQALPPAGHARKREGFFGRLFDFD